MDSLVTKYMLIHFSLIKYNPFTERPHPYENITFSQYIELSSWNPQKRWLPDQPEAQLCDSLLSILTYNTGISGVACFHNMHTSTSEHIFCNKINYKHRTSGLHVM